MKELLMNISHLTNDTNWKYLLIVLHEVGYVNVNKNVNTDLQIVHQQIVHQPRSTQRRNKILFFMNNFINIFEYIAY